MSDEKTYTEREVVKRERAAYQRGWLRGVPLGEAVTFNLRLIEARATKLYPLPTVTRPRTAPDPHEPEAQWRWYPNLGRYGEFGVAAPDISDGDFYSPLGRRWEPTPARVRMWADLLDNPTETVEDES